MLVYSMPMHAKRCNYIGNAWVQQYHLKDHLGNVWVIVDQSKNVKETNDYYAFGSRWVDASSVVASPANRYRYNGMEEQNWGNLGYYDYNARFYNPAIGRFSSIDPHAEKYYNITSYNYAFNNPLRFIDPDGKDGWDFLKGIKDGIVQTAKNVANFVSNPVETIDYVKGEVSAGRGGQLYVNTTLKPLAKPFTGLADLGATMVNEAASGGNGSKSGEAVGEAITEVAATYAGIKAVSATSKVVSGLSKTSQTISTTGVRGYRYMSKGELGVITGKENGVGFLRGGNAGKTFFTKDLYKSATKAQQRLSLPIRPELRVEFEIQNNPILQLNGTKVAPAFGMPGKGAEFMTTDPVKVNIINWQPLGN